MNSFLSRQDVKIEVFSRNGIEQNDDFNGEVLAKKCHF
jgi:hypothetical protein